MIEDKEKSKLEKYNKLYDLADRADKEIFAEQRNNILIKSGKHYKKKSVTAFSDTVRGFAQKFNKPEIRITKNLIPKIVNIYIESILNGNPSVTTVPYNDSELSDIKAAKLAASVIEWVKRTNNWRKRRKKFVDDYVTIGETFAKITFDPTEGDLIDAIDENGNQVRVPSGQIVIDKVFGFDVRLDPSARDFDDARWLIQDSLMDKDEFEEIVREYSPENLENIKGGIPKGHFAFDAFNGTISEVKDKVSVKELFYRPSLKYPNGKYVMFTKDFIVTETELPFGIWPWAYCGFEEMTTSPRSYSLIRTCRPYQIEINRASSKMAEHQITLGDDKVYIQSGTRLTKAGDFSGIKAFSYTGQPPIISEGRSGAQYLEYQVRQIQEMFDAVNLSFILQDKQNVQGDPYLMLFSSMKDKKVFSRYSEKYEDFEVDIFKIALKLAKKYLTDQVSIKIVGSSEFVNIKEFQKTKEDSFDFVVEPMSGDIETKFGKVLTTTAIMQYAGSSLPPEEIGKLIRSLPYGDKEELFSSLTLNYDNAVNDILALDRGEMVQVRENDDHVFLANMLTARTRKADFKNMPDNIKRNYDLVIQEHLRYFQEEQQKLQQAEMGMIPAGGYLTTVNASWKNPVTGMVERIKVPSESIAWLVQKLQQQGALLQELDKQPQAVDNNNPEPQVQG